MKTAIVLFLVLLLAGSAIAGDVYVKGYWKDSDGDGTKDTYVNPYYRTRPDDSVTNNYSTKGNTNPYTGRPGTVDPYDTYKNTPTQNPYSVYK